MEDGERLKSVMIEGEPHIPVIGVSIFREQADESGKPVREVLLVQGAHDKWYPPGGKIREDEDIVEALKRELGEELGTEVAGSLQASGNDVGYYEIAGSKYAIANVVLKGNLSKDPYLKSGGRIKAFKWTADPFSEDLTEQARAVFEKQMPKAVPSGS